MKDSAKSTTNLKFSGQKLSCNGCLFPGVYTSCYINVRLQRFFSE